MCALRQGRRHGHGHRRHQRRDPRQDREDRRRQCRETDALSGQCQSAIRYCCLKERAPDNGQASGAPVCAATRLRGLPLHHPTPTGERLVVTCVTAKERAPDDRQVSRTKSRRRGTYCPIRPDPCRTLRGPRLVLSAKRYCLEREFWDGLKEIAVGRGVSVSALVTSINSEQRHGNLSSAVRVFVLRHYRASE